MDKTERNRKSASQYRMIKATGQEALVEGVLQLCEKVKYASPHDTAMFVTVIQDLAQLEGLARGLRPKHKFKRRPARSKTARMAPTPPSSSSALSTPTSYTSFELPELPDFLNFTE